MSNWFALPHLAALRVTGNDAIAFCQAQFTADLRSINPAHWQITAWCDAKGRCLSIILAAINEDHVELIFPASQSERIAGLKPYAIGRQVQISAGLPVAGRFGPASGDIVLGQQARRALRIGQEASADDGFELAWRVADLCQPLPWLNDAQSGRFLPQILGLESNGGLSYRKGCFPGQEVIARVHYLGKVKQQLLGFVLDPKGASGVLEPARLQSQREEGQAEVLDWLEVNQRIIGLAVCPAAWPAGLAVHFSAPGKTIEGQMVTTDALCYYRPNNDYKHGINQ